MLLVCYFALCTVRIVLGYQRKKGESPTKQITTKFQQKTFKKTVFTSVF